MELTVAVHPRACEAGERPRKRLSGGTYCLSLDAERAGPVGRERVVQTEG